MIWFEEAIDYFIEREAGYRENRPVKGSSKEIDVAIEIIEYLSGEFEINLAELVK